MYHQIYYTGRSVTDRTAVDRPQTIYCYTETKSVFFLKVRKLVRPPQCHLIKYYFLTCYEHIDPLFFIFFILASGLII